MHITGEVQVDVLHRHDLRIAAARCTALDTHDWSQGGLADRHHRLAPGSAHGIGQADQHGGLALAGGCWAHCRHEYELALFIDALTLRLQRGNIDLGLGSAIGDKSGFRDAGAFCDCGDGLQGVSLGDVYIAGLRIARCRRISHIPRINVYPCKPPN